MGEGKINYIGQRNNGFMKGELLIMIYKYFTEEELNTLSNGILALIHNACTAKKLMCDAELLSAINKELNKFALLNSRICSSKSSNKKVYAYDFFDGDKGVVFATSKENATDKVKYIYGTEYCNYHDIEVKEAEMWDVDVFSTTNTWN